MREAGGQIRSVMLTVKMGTKSCGRDAGGGNEPGAA